MKKDDEFADLVKNLKKSVKDKKNDPKGMKSFDPSTSKPPSLN